MIQSKWKEHSCETQDIWLINSHKRCASHRWEFQRTSWGLDSQSRSVKWELDRSPSKCLGVLACPWQIGWRFCYMLWTPKICNTALVRGISQSPLPTRCLLGKTRYSQHSSLGFCFLWTQVKDVAKNEIKIESRCMRAPEAAGWFLFQDRLVTNLLS